MEKESQDCFVDAVGSILISRNKEAVITISDDSNDTTSVDTGATLK